MASSYAILAGLSGLAYAYFFVIARNPTGYSIALMLSGLFALYVAVHLYEKLRDVEVTYAKVAALLLVVGSLGALLHGGYDLANAINPPTGVNPSLPSQVDPRGLLTFAVTGLGIIKLSYLMRVSKTFSDNLSLLGLLSGALLIFIYVARLTILDPANPALLYPILLEGFVINPIWYIWLGMEIKKRG